MVYYITINNDYKVKDPSTGLAQVTPVYVRDGRIQDAQTRLVFRNGVTTKINTDSLPGKKLPESIERMIEKGILKVVKKENPQKEKENKIPINIGKEKEAEKGEEKEEEKLMIVDYSSMLKKDLKEELDRRGIPYDENALKEDLIMLLEMDDSQRV